MTRAQFRLLAIGSFGALLIGGVAFSFWILIHPHNALTNLFRREISDLDARVVFGPYPDEADMRLLAANDVKTIVTLMNPDIPYEGVLLDQEVELAAHYGIRVHVFPMSSILGQPFGEHYEDNARRAAEFIANAKGKVFLHCYLGKHRIRTVVEILESIDQSVGKYSRDASRPADLNRLEAAQDAADERDWEKTLEILATIGTPTRASMTLEAWTLYRLKRHHEARAMFLGLLEAEPESTSARIGVGFAELALEKLEDAEARFSSVLATRPQHADARLGMGIVRFEQGRLDEAVKNLEGVLATNPSYDDARIWLERVEKTRAKLSADGPADAETDAPAPAEPAQKK